MLLRAQGEGICDAVPQVDRWGLGGVVLFKSGARRRRRMRKEEGMQQTGFKLDSRKNLLPTKLLVRKDLLGEVAAGASQGELSC